VQKFGAWLTIVVILTALTLAIVPSTSASIELVPIEDYYTIYGYGSFGGENHLDVYWSSIPWIDASFSPLAQDGYIENSDLDGGAPYVEVHDATTGIVYGDNNVFQIGQDHYKEVEDYAYFIDRAGIYFDTSSLPDDAGILPTNGGYTGISLYCSRKAVQEGYDFNVVVVSGADLLDYTLKPEDYGHLLEDNDSRGSINTASITENEWCVIPLNSIGVSEISKTGVTKFGVKSSRDIAVDPPTGTDQQLVQFDSYEAGADTYPKLEVDYIIPGVGQSGAYLKFDLEPLRDLVFISKMRVRTIPHAELRLYCTQIGNMTDKRVKLWGVVGQEYHTLDEKLVDVSNQWYSFDVTSWINYRCDHMSRMEPPFEDPFEEGLLQTLFCVEMKMWSEGTMVSTSFASKESGTPKLVIWEPEGVGPWTPPPEQPPPENQPPPTLPPENLLENRPFLPPPTPSSTKTPDWLWLLLLIALCVLESEIMKKDNWGRTPMNTDRGSSPGSWTFIWIPEDSMTIFVLAALGLAAIYTYFGISTALWIYIALLGLAVMAFIAEHINPRKLPIAYIGLGKADEWGKLVVGGAVMGGIWLLLTGLLTEWLGITYAITSSIQMPQMSIGISLFFLGFLVPPIEEMFFRQTLSPTLAESIGIIPGIVISGMFFGAAHYAFGGSLALAVSAAGLGIVLAFFTLRHQGAIFAHSAHMTYNLLVIIINYLIRAV